MSDETRFTFAHLSDGMPCLKTKDVSDCLTKWCVQMLPLGSAWHAHGRWCRSLLDCARYVRFRFDQPFQQYKADAFIKVLCDVLAFFWHG